MSWRWKSCPIMFTCLTVALPILPPIKLCLELKDVAPEFFGKSFHIYKKCRRCGREATSFRRLVMFQLKLLNGTSLNNGKTRRRVAFGCNSSPPRSRGLSCLFSVKECYSRTTEFLDLVAKIDLTVAKAMICSWEEWRTSYSMRFVNVSPSLPKWWNFETL